MTKITHPTATDNLGRHLHHRQTVQSPALSGPADDDLVPAAVQRVASVHGVSYHHARTLCRANGWGVRHHG